jgi:hypothetical protein
VAAVAPQGALLVSCNDFEQIVELIVQVTTYQPTGLHQIGGDVEEDG